MKGYYDKRSFIKSFLLIKYILRVNLARNYGGGSGGLEPHPFPQKDKIAPFLLTRSSFIIIIKLESNEIQKIPVIFFRIYTGKILFQAISALKIFSVPFL